MICSNCGKSATESARFCLHCGAPVNAPPSPLRCGRCSALPDGAGAFCSRCGFRLTGDTEQVPASSTKRGPRRVSFMVPAAILVVILCSVFFWHAGTPASGSGTQGTRGADGGSSTPDPTQPAGGTGPSTATRQPDNSDTNEPPLADVVLHPNELIKDPFSNRGKRIRLDVAEYPVLFENNLIRYMMYTGPPGIGEQLTPKGVRFKRMFSPTYQLYDVTAVSQGGLLSRGTSYNDVISLGELLVRVPSGQAELDAKRSWVVEPLGTVEGTNGFGATISIAAVRFSAYYDPQTQNWPIDEDASVKDPTTGMVYYPIVYAAYNLLKFPPKFKGRLIQLETGCISVIQNGSFTAAYCAGPDKMPSISVDKPLSDSAAIYSVNAIKSETADAPLFQVGKVLISNNDGPISKLKLGRTWLVEVLGPVRVPADSGEPAVMPGYRFVSYF
jgi:hypothetical protein